MFPQSVDIPVLMVTMLLGLLQLLHHLVDVLLCLSGMPLKQV